MLASDSSTREAMLDVQAALGAERVDLRLTQCQLVNVYSGEIYPTEIAIRGQRIVAIRTEFDGEADQTIDCRNQYVIPGYVEPRAAVHLAGAAGGLLRLGVTSVVLQPDGECSGASSVRAVSSPRLFREAHDSVGDDMAGDSVPAIRTVRRIQSDREGSGVAGLVQAVRSGNTVIIDIPADAGERHALLSAAGNFARDAGSLIVRQFGASGRQSGRSALADLMAVGIDVVDAIRMTSLNAAVHYGIDHEVGSIVPGRLADLLVYRRLTDERPAMVIFGGQVATTI